MRLLPLLGLSLLFAACDSTPEEPGPSDAAVADAGAGATDAGAEEPDAGACPRLTCADLDLSGGPEATRYDPAARMITLVLKPEAPEVVSGAFTFQVATAGMAPMSRSTVLTVEGRALSADLSRWLSNDAVYFGQLSVTAVSACGATGTFGNLEPTTGQGIAGITVESFACR